MLLYPVFLTIGEAATSEFWRQIFYRMACNLPPQGLYITQTPHGLIVRYNHEKRGFTYPMEVETPEGSQCTRICEELRNLLITRADVYSVYDKIPVVQAEAPAKPSKKSYIKTHNLFRQVTDNNFKKTFHERNATS